MKNKVINRIKLILFIVSIILGIIILVVGLMVYYTYYFVDMLIGYLMLCSGFLLIGFAGIIQELTSRKKVAKHTDEKYRESAAYHMTGRVSGSREIVGSTFKTSIISLMYCVGLFLLLFIFFNIWLTSI